MGMTLLELAIPVLAVAGTLVVTMGASRAPSQETSREIATRAAQAMHRALAATDFSKVFASYDGDISNDPCGPGTAPGSYFEVPGLTPPEGVSANQVGRVLFPSAGRTLREDVILPKLGMPQDLNGDGAIDMLDHAHDYKILPVLVEVRWRSLAGDESIAIPAVLKPRREKPTCFSGQAGLRRPA